MPKIALLFAALHIPLMLFLAYRVAAHRHTAKIGLGVAGDYKLERKVRAHANFVEYVPTGLVALALLELCGLAAPWLYAFGSVLFVGRLLHAFGISRKSGYSPGRFTGTLLTWLSLAAMAVAGFVVGLGAMQVA